MAGMYLCETCFDAMTGHVVDVRGWEEAICDDCIGGSKTIVVGEAWMSEAIPFSWDEIEQRLFVKVCGD